MESTAPSSRSSPGQRDGPRDHLGQGRLASAVLAEQRVDLSGPDRDVDVLDRGDTAINLVGLASGQERRRLIGGISLAGTLVVGHQLAVPLGDHEDAPAGARETGDAVVAVDAAVQRAATFVVEAYDKAVGARRCHGFSTPICLDAGALQRFEERLCPDDSAGAIQ